MASSDLAMRLVVILAVAVILAVGVYCLQCHRLAGLMRDRLPAAARGPVGALAWPGRRCWVLPNRAGETDAVKALNEVADLYPSWIAGHRLYSVGLSSKWVLVLRRPDSRPIPSSRLPMKGTLRRIPIGFDVAGRVVSMPAAVHTLVVSLTGGGKSNLMAVIVRQLLPLTRQGLARLWVIDLKAGMEAAMYGGGIHRVFDRQAWTMEDAVRMLSDLAEECERRAETARGRTRDIQPTRQTPRIYLLVDEAAQLHGGADRKLASEATRLLDSLLRRARALGITVIAFTQNPRVDSIPLRAGFPQRIALRLNDAAEARMLMGEECIAHGAAPWRLTLPGSGYIWDPELGEARYFRTPYITDREIRSFDARQVPDDDQDDSRDGDRRS